MFKFVSQKIKGFWPQSKSLPSDDELRRIIKEKGLNHIAIVPDGDRRWAVEKGLEPLGWQNLVLKQIPMLYEELWRLGVNTTTLFMFSTENWKREQNEIDSLFIFFEDCLKGVLAVARKMQVRMIHLGRKDRLSPALIKLIQVLETETSHYSKHVFNFGLDYGSRDEISRAYNKLLERGVKEVDEKVLFDVLDTAHQPFPNPDLLIRTGKVTRLSNFMVLQAACSELYFPQKYFPDFDKMSLHEAIFEFSNRKRTLGK